eukprot:TRINITY_DN16354_c0_g1_i1.p1 TRINITY_DN16354_c0_g1~~TRINITY_DN16354_c0_g1_i1.p1  ORF type:complete len:444 (-),score=57.33 TRINITY_DN16354_c0_g1_i1:247-1578(-)
MPKRRGLARRSPAETAQPEAASVDERHRPQGDAAANSELAVPDLASLLVPVKEGSDKRASKAGVREGRAKVAAETLKILAAGGYRCLDGTWVDIQEAVLSAVNTSSFHPAASWCHPAKQRQHDSVVEIRCCTVLAAAEELAQAANHVGVLNFASARNPGGGFLGGAEAQEESIARGSAIYPCLTKHMESFYTPNRHAQSGEYTHDMIYSPKVPVLRDDAGSLLKKPYLVDFLTSPAPNCGVMKRADARGGARRAAEVLDERVHRALGLFAAHGATDLVLGAWGCGVFGNDPRVVADIFKWQLECKYKGLFRRVYFAVLDPRMASTFGEAFQCPAARPTLAGSGKPMTNSAQLAEPADSETAEEQEPGNAEKAVHKAAKLLREILKLEEKALSGSRLQQGQQAKLQRKAEVLRTLNKLVKELPAESQLWERDAALIEMAKADCP